jgi:hypothetical protein
MVPSTTASTPVAASGAPAPHSTVRTQAPGADAAEVANARKMQGMLIRDKA